MAPEEIDLLIENITAYLSAYGMIMHPPHEGDPEEKWHLYFRYVLKSYFDKQTKLKDNIFQNVPAERVWENNINPFTTFTGPFSGAAAAAPAPNTTITVVGVGQSSVAPGTFFPPNLTLPPASTVGTTFTISSGKGDLTSLVWDGTSYIDTATGKPHI